MRLRVRPGSGLHSVSNAKPGVSYSAGTEFVVSYSDAATLLKGEGRRAFEIVEDFEADEPPDETISIGRP